MSWINVIAEATTLLSFAVFIGVVWFAYGKGREARFDRAAQAPFDLPDELDGDAHRAAQGTRR